MSPRPTFDVVAHPLLGAHLVEASAGTGKTTCITTLYLRFLLERGLRTDQVLAVSFARASTADLRGRVRQRIAEAIRAFRGEPAEDEALRRIVEARPAAVALPLLETALADFDRAAIYTIHGFCQRALVEFAFLSGEPFAVEFVEDANQLYEELARDHWAAHAYDATPEWLQALDSVYSGPASLLDLAKRAAERPDIRVLPAPGARQVRRDSELAAAFGRCVSSWNDDRDAIVAHLHEARVLASARPALLGPALRALADAMSRPHAPSIPEGGRVFTARALAGVTKRGHAPPGHPFFQLWDAYWHAATGQLGADFIDLQRELFLHARTRLEHRKNTRNIRAYSDLLARLAGALDGPGGPALADALFRRYPAALIDEFQDTDPVQFTVFQRAYAGGRGSMFLVGDPKQAIYAFRGGDIYAYLRATATASVATLDTNWRSDTPLVEALALLYRSDSTPFLDRRIPFVNVKAAHPARILGPSGEAAPLQLKMIRWDPSKGTRNITAGWADRKLASLVAADIVRFLRSDARLFRGGDRDDPARWSHPVPSDVAVLVRKNADAARVQEALADLGVNSVVSSEVSVFATREARELAAVLAAVLHPSRDARLRAAVVSDIVGLGGNALAEAVADDATWAAWAACFRDLGGRWTRSGFAAVLRRILVEPLRPGHTPALERLVRLPRGERRVTNLLHLGELLQERAMRHSLSPPALLAWLDERRSGRGDRADEEQLRLESDAQAVTILTVYKGKGLQYSAVWCPYGHVSFDADRVRPLYHGEPPGEVATIDLDPGSWADSDTPAAAEAAAQERRVLYVSLTRAAQRLTLFWGQLNKADKSALAALLHPPSGIGGMKEPAIMAALQGVAARSGGRIQASWLDESPPPRWAGSSRVEALPISTFAGHVRRSWRRTSYTDLTRTDLPHDEASDHDEVDEGQPGAGAASPGAATPHDALPCSFGAFPAGARPGSAIHEIFECIDFGDGGPGIEQATRAVLGRFRLAGPHLLADTCASVTRALTTALGGRLGAFSLSQLPSARRLVEVAFTFPVSGRGPSAPVLSRRALASFLRARGRAGLAERVDGLSFGSLRGHLTGVIDLAFEHEGRWYIADYKSNHLGKMLGDYHPGALAAEVARHDYDLQYLLYAVALHRHLALRLRGYAFERHFGGVRYLFLRGMHPLAGPERGVHADDLDSALVCGLDELLRDPAKVTP